MRPHTVQALSALMFLGMMGLSHGINLRESNGSYGPPPAHVYGKSKR